MKPYYGPHAGITMKLCEYQIGSRFKTLCGKRAVWLIGTAHVPVCSKHHKKWLEQFNPRKLQKKNLEIIRIKGSQ